MRTYLKQVLFTLMLVASLALSACNAGGPKPTATPAAPTAQPEVRIAATTQPEVYSMSGNVYNAAIFVNTLKTTLSATALEEVAGNYNLVVTENGRWFQPEFPGPDEEHPAYSLAITLPEGEYQFNGVSCRLHLDTERNGKGTANKAVANHENDLKFTVDTTDGGEAWAVIECDQVFNNGVELWALNWK